MIAYDIQKLLVVSLQSHLLALLWNIIVFEIELEEHGCASIYLLLDQILVRLNGHYRPIEVPHERWLVYGCTPPLLSCGDLDALSLRLTHNRLNLDACAHWPMGVLFFVVFFIEDHACESAIDPAWPLMEAFVRPLTLYEQFIAVQVHDSLGHRMLKLEWQHCHLKEFALRFLSLFDTLDPGGSRAPITRNSLREILPTIAALTVSDIAAITVLLPLRGHQFALSDIIYVEHRVWVVVRGEKHRGRIELQRVFADISSVMTVKEFRWPAFRTFIPSAID